MNAKDITWNTIKRINERKYPTLNQKFCHAISSCDKCNIKIKFYCKIMETIRVRQEKLITKQLDKQSKGKENTNDLRRRIQTISIAPKNFGKSKI